MRNLVESSNHVSKLTHPQEYGQITGPRRPRVSLVPCYLYGQFVSTTYHCYFQFQGVSCSPVKCWNLICLPLLNVPNLLVTISVCHRIRPNFVRVLHIWSSVPNILRIHAHCWSYSGAVPFGAYSICQVLPSPQMLQPGLKILEFQHTYPNPTTMFRHICTYQLGPDPDLSQVSDINNSTEPFSW